MATDYALTLQDYMSILRRGSRLLAGIFVSAFLISVIVIFVIPPTYRSTSVILVESQQIPENVVSGAIKNPIDEQISVVNQRVMTRENLLPIANKYSLAKDYLGSLSSVELIEKLRNKISIEIISANITESRSRAPKQTMTFSLSFEDQNPEVAFKVTKELTDLYLHLNSKLRVEGATGATDFLTHESDTLKVEVDRLENLIAAFKLKNRNALPEQLNLRMSLLARAENDLREVERDYRSTKDELRAQEFELSAATQITGDNTQTQSLPMLKAELARLSGIYKESHPDIRRLKLRIEALTKAGAIPNSETTSTEDLNPTAVLIRTRIDSSKARLLSLSQQKEMLQNKIFENSQAMVQTPKVAQELDILIRERDAVLRKFEELSNKRTNAKIAENLESENKSGRFTVLEPPILPEKVFKPNRLKFLLSSFFLSLAFAAGVIMLLELVNKPVRGLEELTHIVGYRPLAAIPDFPSKEAETGMKHAVTRILTSLGRG